VGRFGGRAGRDRRRRRSSRSDTTNDHRARNVTSAPYAGVWEFTGTPDENKDTCGIGAREPTLTFHAAVTIVPEADGVGWILGSGSCFICNETCVPCAWNAGFFDDTNGVLVLRI
jgi:hypothetical protein